MAVYKRDIVDINLETGNIHRSFLKHSIGYMDQKADHFGIRAYRDGVPVDLTGVSVQGVFMPPQGSPIAITSGNIVDFNEAEVVLPQACYNYDGQFTLAIKLVDSTNSVTGTMRIVDGMVDNTHASGTVAPTEAVPTYQEIIAVYEDLVDALADVADYAENFAPAFAAGTANAAGSYVMYEGDLYLLPDGHTANTTWANTTKTQVTTGGEMVKLAQADSDLKSAFEQNELFEAKYGNPNLINPMRMVDELIASSSVSVTWNGTKATFYGTAAGNGICHVYLNETVIPAGMKAGETYHLKYQGTLVKCYIYYYVSGSSTAAELLNTYEDVDFTLPATAVGLNVRLRVVKNSVLNETVEAPFIYATSNASITIREDVDIANRSATAGLYVGMYHKNMIPKFAYSGKTITVTIPENGSLRCVNTNNKAIATSGNLSGDYEVAKNNVLVFNLTSKTLSVKAIADLVDEDVVLLYNSSNGGLIGQWASFYYIQKLVDEKNVVNNLVPEYYDDHLDEKVAEINTIAATLPKASGRIFFVTDYHIGNNKNANISPILVNDLINRTGIRKMVFGGDAYDAEDTPNKAQDSFYKFLDLWRPIEERAEVFYITGNHEYNRPGGQPVENELPMQTIWDMYMGYASPNGIVRFSYTNAFYWDDEIAKIRYYFLDCSYNSTIDPDSVNTQMRKDFSQSLLTVPEGYSVLVFSHMGINNISTSTIESRIVQICRVCEAMNEGRSITIEFKPGDLSIYDFTGKARPFIGVISGHKHVDGYIYHEDTLTEKKFPVIVTTCDAYGKAGGNEQIAQRTLGTIYEQAFDVLQIDTANKIIYMTRIGWGNDRAFGYGETTSGPVAIEFEEQEE